jgi:Family of unknown function (DUF6152)
VNKFSCVAIAAIAVAASTVAWGHHSYSMFDMQKVVEVAGTVREFRYTNPHSWIVMAIQDATGQAINATVEANGPGYLARFGWNRNTLKPGDKIVVSINPLRDGSPGGSLVKVQLADGRELNARPELPGPPAGPALGPAEHK